MSAHNPHKWTIQTEHMEVTVARDGAATAIALTIRDLRSDQAVTCPLHADELDIIAYGLVRQAERLQRESERR
jgi:hypothetical protein